MKQKRRNEHENKHAFEVSLMWLHTWETYWMQHMIWWMSYLWISTIIHNNGWFNSTKFRIQHESIRSVIIWIIESVYISYARLTSCISSTGNTTNRLRFECCWRIVGRTMIIFFLFICSVAVLFHLKSRRCHAMLYHEYRTCFRFLSTLPTSTFNPIRLSFSSILWLIQFPSWCTAYVIW